jgi:hypothetical protein
LKLLQKKHCKKKCRKKLQHLLLQFFKTKIFATGSAQIKKVLNGKARRNLNEDVPQPGGTYDVAKQGNCISDLTDTFFEGSLI